MSGHCTTCGHDVCMCDERRKQEAREDAQIAMRVGERIIELEAEVERLRAEVEEAQRWEAVCHCGLELSRHSELTEHVATEATVPCPNEDALKAALAVLQEIAAKAAYEGDDDYFQIASMGIKR